MDLEKSVQRLPSILVCVALGVSLAAADARLAKAVLNGTLQQVKALLDQGADRDGVDAWGWTPLLWATFYKNEPAVRWLLAKGADPDKASILAFRTFPPGTTPLMVAAYYGNTDLITTLLGRKADPLRTNAEGVQAAAIARSFFFKECAWLLEGRPGAAPTLHAHAHPLLEGRIGPVVIVLKGWSRGSGTFLAALEKDLKGRLEARGIPCAFVPWAPRAEEREKALAAAAGTIQARQVLYLSEIDSVLKDAGDHPGRVSVRFVTELRRWGTSTTLWEREQAAEDSSGDPGLALVGDAARNLGAAVLDDLWADDLL